MQGDHISGPSCYIQDENEKLEMSQILHLVGGVFNLIEWPKSSEKHTEMP